MRPLSALYSHASATAAAVAEPSADRRVAKTAQQRVYEFPAQITSHTLFASNRWTYAGAEVTFNAATGAASVLTNGRTFTAAWNEAETRNAASGELGNGLNTTDSPGVSLKPIGGGSLTSGASALQVIVRVTEFIGTDGTRGYRFDKENGVKCP